MASQKGLILRRLRQRRLSGRSTARYRWRAGTIASLGAGLLLLGVIFGAVLLYKYLWTDIPAPEALPALLDSPNGQLLQPTTLYDRSGLQLIAILENPAAHERAYLSFPGNSTQSLPQALVDATLVSVDPDFWQHNGYDLTDLNPEHHPTLAQSLVYETLLSEEPASLRRSLRERLLAAQVTARYGKEKILEWYLNHASYGSGVFGADAGALTYFGKSASDLSLAESAALAAIAQFPEVNPYQAPQVILESRDQILEAMRSQELISLSQQQTAARQILLFAPAVGAEQTAPAFVELVLSELAAQFPRQRLERGGWRIITTLDMELQAQVNCTSAKLIQRYSSASEDKNPDDVACPAARLLPTLSLQETLALSKLESGVIVLDPHTGQILSLAGDEQIITQMRPSGTLGLPFLYLNAFSRGFSPGTLAWDIPSEGAATHAISETYAGPVRLRSALVNDYLSPAAQLIAQFGLGTTLTTARQLGAFSGALPPSGEDALRSYLSQSAGLIGLAQAYATLDNQGVAAGQVIQPETSSEIGGLRPYAVLRLEDQDRQVWLDWSIPVQQSVLSPQLAYLINHSLSDEVSRWSSLGHPNALEIGRPASAKLGQTLEQQDAWAFGYTPQRLVGVWLGLPGEETDETISTDAASALWHAIIQYASRGQPADGWSAPLGISQVQVCDPSGLLPTIYCPLTVSEVFLTGSEPTQTDNLYQLYQINRETGHLATVFTSPELVEEKVFLIVPAEARAWAAQAGLPTPPEDYDALSALPTVNAEVNLSAPTMFSYVRGEVTLSGSAQGAGFQFFRLNFGQGLFPQQWLQIGTDSKQPVKVGKLGTWDTEGLNGLYALQLQVVRLDQRVETALIQVTVDNIFPEVTLLSPAPGAEYSLALQPNLVLNARASDNLALAQVVFYIDDQQAASLAAPPYRVAWPAKPGEHTLKVIARDLAGNESSSQILFSIK